MTIQNAFDETAAYYDSWASKSLPAYDTLFSIAKSLPPFPDSQPIRVLDLGAGTGLFSQHMLGRYPHAHFTLVDTAAKMLEVAQNRFAAYPGQFTCCQADFRSMELDGQFDLAISSLAIHHLEDEEKAALFRQIHGLLRSPGVFVNVDQVRGPTPALKDRYWNDWLQGVRQRGGTEERIQQSIQRRTTYDRDATLLDQLRWLAEAGFADVDCIYKNYFIAVFYAAKA